METQSPSIEYYSNERSAPFTSLREGFWVLFVAIIGTGMSFIDSTGINTILPILQRELGAKITQAQWVIESYALFVSSLILFGGALGDKFGRKKIFIIGLIIARNIKNIRIFFNIDISNLQQTSFVRSEVFIISKTKPDKRCYNSGKKVSSIGRIAASKSNF